MNSRKIILNYRNIKLYHEGEGDTAFFFVYGQISSIELLKKVFSGELSHKYSLAALDLPGHGGSEAARNPAESYTFEGYGDAIVAAVKHLGLKRVIYAGHSIGGHMLMQNAHRLPALEGLIIFGTTPFSIPPAYDRAFLPHPATAHLFSEHLSKQINSQWAEALLKTGSPVPEFLYTNNDRIDPVSRPALEKSIGRGEMKDEVKAVEQLPFPLGLFHAREDRLINSGYLEELNLKNLWRKKIIYLEGCGHSPQWEKPREFSQLLDAYAREICG